MTEAGPVQIVIELVGQSRPVAKGNGGEKAPFPLVKDIVLSECQFLLTLRFLYQSILPTKR